MLRVLPFPRDNYYCQGAVTPTAYKGDELEGKVIKVHDDASPGNEKLLRIVRNASGSTITVAAGKLVAFAVTDADDFGCQVSGYQTSAGGVCKPLDDLYSAKLSWLSLDLAYVVEKGRCTVPKTTGGGTAILAGAQVFCHTDSKANGAVASGYSIGRCAVAAGDDDDTVEVEVAEGFV